MRGDHTNSVFDLLQPNFNSNYSPAADSKAGNPILRPTDRLPELPELCLMRWTPPSFAPASMLRQTGIPLSRLR